jgi:hypothetical protein
VFFNVVSSRTRKAIAVIAFGWESAEFYAKWMGDNAPEIIWEMKGPILNSLSPQSELAPQILKLVPELILLDQAYVQRLKTHYWMFRHLIDTKPKRKAQRKK